MLFGVFDNFISSKSVTIKEKQFSMKFHCLSVWQNDIFLHHIAQII